MKLSRPLALAVSLLLLCSCTPSIPQPDPETPPVETAPLTPQVQVDWSKLEQSKGDAAHPDLDAGRWYTETTPDLIPSDKYGPLYSYVGACVQGSQRWTDQSGEDHIWTSDFPSPVYGLMTREGKVVTDPSYQGVYQPTYRREGQVIPLPILLLSRASQEWDDGITNGQRYAVCAKDGSWCTGFEFWTYAINESSILLAGSSGVTQLDPMTGNRCDWSWDTLGFSDTDLSPLLNELMWLYGFRWIEDGVFLGLIGAENMETALVRLFHPEDGSISLVSVQEFEAMLYADAQQDWGIPDQWESTLEGGTITLSQGESRYIFSAPADMDTLHSVEINDDLVILSDYGHPHAGTWLYHLSTGTMLAQANYIGFIQDFHHPDLSAFVHIMYANGSQSLYGPNFTPFLSYPSPAPTAQAFFIYQDNLIFARDDATFFGCYDAQTFECIFYRNLSMGD